MILAETYSEKKTNYPPSVKPIKLCLHSSAPALTDRCHMVESVEQLGLGNIDMDDFINRSAQWTVKFSRSFAFG